MTDYDKLTVVKLREELVKRGLPKTGLKAALVQRLLEADSQPAQPAPAPEQQKEKSSPAVQTEVDEESTAPEPQTRPDRDANRDSHHQSPADGLAQQDGRQASSAPLPDADASRQLPTTTEVSSTSSHTPAEAADISVQEQPTPTSKPDTTYDTETKKEQSAKSLNHKYDTNHDTETDNEVSAKIAEDVGGETLVEEGSTETTSRLEDQSLSQTSVPPMSTQTSTLGNEELKEDTNKRKRRSQSPPPSSIDNARKRTKADDGRPQVKLPEDEESRATSERAQHQKEVDTGMIDAPTEVMPEQPVEKPDINGDVRMHEDAEPSPAIAKQATDPEVSDSTPVHENSTIQSERPVPQVDGHDTPPQSANTEISSKQSPSDARFKNLFSGPSKREGSPPRQKPRNADEDRVITPALHPATSALYIRDFMRPINAVHLKDYLCTLATPADTDPDPEIITHFFLDNVRTHCFVAFSNTSAAARVRIGIHDRVWPDEATRKPLWADFVPEEKLAKWIEVETKAAGDRRQGMKKWEVIYEQEEAGVTAFLQEASPNSSAPRTVQPMLPRKESIAAVHRAPSGPRSRNEDIGRSQPDVPGRSDSGKGFQALDELFKATAAKPKLYYLPVSQDIANRRLDRLAAGRGGGRSDEKRRYTFEDGSLVDKGPEFGFRRGGHIGRGGGGHGGYQGRGGGYRGDAWRGRR